MKEKPLWAERLRHPDKPIRMYKRNIQELEDTGKYVAEEKMDGFRILIFRRDDDWQFLSRQLDWHIPLSDLARKALMALPIPQWSLIDGEWSKRRKAYKGLDIVTVFSAIAWDGIILNQKGELERIAPLNTELDLSDEWLHSPVRKCKFVYDNMVGFFETTKEHPETEGMVLKDLKAPLILSRKKCEKNPAHIKIKWRDGSAGDLVVD